MFLLPHEYGEFARTLIIREIVRGLNDYAVNIASTQIDLAPEDL
jgi:hypothetical protein